MPSNDAESTGIAMQRVAIASQITKNATEMSLEEARNSHMRLRFINHLNRGEWGWIESRLKSAIGYPWTVVNRLRQAKYQLANASSEEELTAFLKAGRAADSPDSVSNVPMPGFAWMGDEELSEITAYLKSL